MADCVPSYRLLLPLSSTCRHFYELIHEEDISALAQATNTIHDVSVRVSCWRHHPTVHVAITRTAIAVDGCSHSLEQRDDLFVSYVLTSLRNVPFLELSYSCAGGPHAANLYPLRHFSHLRSLVLLLGAEHSTRQQNLTTHLSAALFSLPSLLSLTAVWPSIWVSSSVILGPDTLSRLARERLLHLTTHELQYDQLTMPVQSLGRRKRNSTPQSTTYPLVQSVASAGRFRGWTLPIILHVFPNVQHVALGRHVGLNVGEMSQVGASTTLFRLDSLHVHVNGVQGVQQALSGGMICQLRCLSLRWSDLHVPSNRDNIRGMLALLPNLQQLAVTGGNKVLLRSHVDYASIPSFFSAPLPQLSYLQLGGLLPADIDYLLSSSSPPAFAVSLTHLVLAVRWSERLHAAALLPVLTDLYPSLQQCHIKLQLSNRVGAAIAGEEWLSTVAALRVRLGAVWCESEAAVREARCDVAWRRSAGLPDVADELLGDMSDAWNE